MEIRPVDIQRVRSALVNRRSEPGAVSAPRLAAVAAILRQTGAEAEVLFIRRAQVEHDPWSGQMAFPGGRADPRDSDLLATAERETAEEIGLDLKRHGTLLGRLDDLPAMAKGKPVGLAIRPFVFALAPEPPALRLNAEVAEVVWGPLGAMTRGELDTTIPYSRPGQDLILPAYDVDDRIVWGLTHRMLAGLFEVLSAFPD